MLATRLSYAGELGWELATGAGCGRRGLGRARARGRRDGAGLEPFGYRALDSLRMEKGYRYYGTDMTMLETPFEAGLGAFVRLEAGPFLGREALVGARERAAAGDGRRLRTVHAGTDGTYLPVYGGEAVRVDGEVVGRLRSVAFGPAVGATIGYVYLDRGVTIGTDLELDVFDGRVPATVVDDVSVDPRRDTDGGRRGWLTPRTQSVNVARYRGWSVGGWPMPDPMVAAGEDLDGQGGGPIPPRVLEDGDALVDRDHEIRAAEQREDRGTSIRSSAGRGSWSSQDRASSSSAASAGPFPAWPGRFGRLHDRLEVRSGSDERRRSRRSPPGPHPRRRSKPHRRRRWAAVA